MVRNDYCQVDSDTDVRKFSLGLLQNYSDFCGYSVSVVAVLLYVAVRRFCTRQECRQWR